MMAEGLGDEVRGLLAQGYGEELAAMRGLGYAQLAPYVCGRIGHEEAVRRLTSGPARILGVHDRGVLRPGAYADITLFNPQTIIDVASYTEAKPSVGIEYVIVNGTVVLEKDKYHTDRLCGSIIRSTDYR